MNEPVTSAPERSMMTQAQKEDLMIEWGIYGPQQQREIIHEYLRLVDGDIFRHNFFNFLRQRLEIDGYWRSVGLL